MEQDHSQTSKARTVLSYFPTVFTMAICIFCNILYSDWIRYAGEDVLHPFLLSFLKDSPVIITASICGYVPAMACVITLFIYKAATFSDLAYTTFVTMLMVVVSDHCSRNYWFASRRKTFLSGGIMAVLSGSAWGILLELSLGIHFLELSPYRILLYSIHQLPCCMFAAVTIYIFFRITPDKWKYFYPMGRRYQKKYLEDIKVNGPRRWHSRLSAKITYMIVVESAFLCILSAFSANILIPMFIDLTANGNSLPAMSVINDSPVEIVSTTILEYSLSLREGLMPINSTVSANVFALDLRIVMLVLSAVVPLASFTNYYAQQRISKPIRKMSSVLRSLKISDDMQTDITKFTDLNINTHDEIEELFMVACNIAYLMQDFISTEREKKQLTYALESAEAANEAKNAFLSSMSHEIRTPINAILGMDEVIIRDTHEKETLRYANDIRNASKTLMAIVNDILDFSKIEAGKMSLVEVEYDLTSIINDISGMASVQARKKNLTFHVEVNEDMPHILYGDEVRIKQCMVNLVNNAIKYTDKGSVTMRLDYRKLDDSRMLLKFEVQDTGVGVRPEDIDRMLAPFERIEEEKHHATEGSGLGMSIVQNLLHMMHSMLSIHSNYGQGSTFGFNVEQQVNRWEAIGDFKERYDKSLELANVYQETFQAPEARILVVDDTDTNHLVVKGLLKQTRIQIESAISGYEMLDLIKQNHYDIILLDHRMPGMDGIESLAKMREMPNHLNVNTPVIALTANALSGAREMYAEAGFVDYMAKPVDGIRLEKLLIEYLPPEKVYLPDNEHYIKQDHSDDDYKDYEPAGSNHVLHAIFDYWGLDTDAAYANCGDEATLLQVLGHFHRTIDDKAALLDHYLEDGNFRDYTIQVHGLKSSSRLFGATRLSDMAADLEKAGNEGNIAFIRASHPAFMELYLSYKQILEPFDAEELSSSKELPEIERDRLQEAYQAMLEYAVAYDYQGADEVVLLLKNYSIPEDQKQDFAEIKRLLLAVNRDELLAQLQKAIDNLA
ncbi:MAG: response regulator [Lachnospiraceae bacterium]|nr:response regulator [Lachnospiraceae bacterium]